MSELTVRGQLYRGGQLTAGVLHIKNGKIVKITNDADAVDVDFGDNAILPGAIDIHVHFREPGATHKEDWTSGTTSAAFGGVTSVVDMPNTNPPTTTMQGLSEKLKLAHAKAVVDYAVWSGCTWYLDDLPEMLKHTPGIKIYLGATTGDLLLDDKDRVHQALKIAGTAGKPVVLHCESNAILQRNRRNEEKLEDHDTTRPPMAEVEAIYDVLKGLPGIKPAPPIHVAHIASAEAVQAAEAAGFGRGVCPHHLLLDTASCCDEQPTRGKMNPPLRSVLAREGLWACFAEGRIPILESDHAPHTKSEKSENFHQAPSGVPGVETLLPVMLAQVIAGRVPLSTVVDAATKAPAKLLGLKDRGALEVGKQADFMVVDLTATTKIDEKKLHSKCGWSPFDGLDAVFPSHVYQRGTAIVENGKLRAKPGDGKPMFPLPEGI
jgi:dihydroorotase